MLLSYTVWLTAMKFGMVRVPSPILVNFGQGRLTHKPIYKSHLGKNRTWLGKIQIAPGKKFRGEVRRAVGIGRHLVGYASCLQAHLFFSFPDFIYIYSDKFHSDNWRAFSAAYISAAPHSKRCSVVTEYRRAAGAYV